MNSILLLLGGIFFSLPHRLTPTCVKTEVALSQFDTDTEFQRNVDIFNSPEKFLKAPDLSASEIKALKEKAKIFLLTHSNAANGNHIADHLESLGKIEAKLKAAGGDPELAALLILIHDLGKEFPALPERYRKKMEDVFKEDSGVPPQFMFLGKQIMGHEFGSMFMIEDMGKELGLSQEKIDKLKALISRHNAGYAPELAGYHFWVRPENWGQFAKIMKEKGGIDFPERYEPLNKLSEGGDVQTIVITANDRGLSLSLASQKKFGERLVKTGKWNSVELAQEFDNNVQGVMKEVGSVLSKLQSSDPKKQSALKDLSKAVVDLHKGNGTLLASVAKRFKPWENGFSIPQSERTTAVFFQPKEGGVIKITADGKLFKSKDGLDWTPEPTTSTNPLEILYDGYLFKEFGEPQRLR